MALVRSYLIAYNVASLLAWSYFVYRVAAHVSTVVALGGLEAVPAAAASLHSEVGTLLAGLLVAATLEVAHAALGLVRSPVAVTALQVCARLIVLFGATRLTPDAWQDWGFVLMSASWGLAEVPRYAFYVAKLLGVVPAPLTWLRYSLFLALYPFGILGEMREIIAALPFVRATHFASLALPNSANAVFSYEAFMYVLLALYIPGSPTMISYMWVQRCKELSSVSSKGKVA